MDIDLATRMTTDEFLAWSETRPKEEHYELQDGEIVRMASERSEHGIVKTNVVVAFSNAIRGKGLPCWVYIDTMAVEIGPDTVFEPDVVMRCGARLDRLALKITDPLIAVEILSPSNRRRVREHKLAGYLSLPSLRHYLVIDPGIRAVTHHCRGDAGWTETTTHDQPITLDPPGIVLANVFD